MGPTDWTRGGDAVIGSYFETDRTGPVPLVLWRLTGDIPEKPERVLLHAPGRRFWQPTYSPDWRWISFVAERIDRPDTRRDGSDPRRRNTGRQLDPHSRRPRVAGQASLGAGRPDLVLSSRESRQVTSTSGAFAWIRSRGTPVGEPFQVTSFDSPDLTIDPNLASSEMDVKGRSLLLVMRKTTGNIWMMSGVDR